ELLHCICILFHSCSFRLHFDNTFPHAIDELDSYMYQTVGHQAIELYADAMELPLYRRTIHGSSLDTSRNYSETEGDEVEDLYQLLYLVKAPISSH
ncbi:diphthine--ammonia ligase, partial [Ameca splendens]